MKNVITMITACVVLAAAMATGMRSAQPQAEESPATEDPGQKIPYIGRVQVLNGCGSVGAAKIVADFLRSKRFDVKNEGNAKTGNYTETMVVSRIKNETVSAAVARALGVRSVLMRNGDEMYDVTVFVGSDFREHVR